MLLKVLVVDVSCTLKRNSTGRHSVNHGNCGRPHDKVVPTLLYSLLHLNWLLPVQCRVSLLVKDKSSLI